LISANAAAAQTVGFPILARVAAENQRAAGGKKKFTDSCFGSAKTSISAYLCDLHFNPSESRISDKIFSGRG
jgi:hypothetical protein